MSAFAADGDHRGLPISRDMRLENAYSLTTCSKPPQNIRLLSKGISMFMSVSASIFSFAASRVALSGYSTQLKIDRLVLFGLDGLVEVRDLALRHVVPPTLDTRVAPRFLKYSAASVACFDVYAPVRGGHGGYEAFDIGHFAPPARGPATIAST